MNSHIHNRVARRGVDGMALIGASVHAMRGLRFVEGEETTPPAPEGEIPATPETPVPDAASFEAKLAEVSAVIAVKDAEIEALNAELLKVRAHNYDLLMQVNSSVDSVTETTIDTPADSVADFDDLFGTGGEDI